jgi:hypothetical protein
MAIQKHKKENLIEQASGYSRRLLIRPQGLFVGQRPVTELFIGCRQSGAWSYYFDESPVLQFDYLSRLRRVHWEPELWMAQAGRLVQLHRDTSGGRVQHSRDQSHGDEYQHRLKEISQLIDQTLNRLWPRIPNEWMARQIPEQDAMIQYDCLQCLRVNSPTLTIALAPHAGA